MKAKTVIIALFLWTALLIFLAIEPGPIMEMFLPTDADRAIAHAFMYGLMAFLFCIFFEQKWNRFGMALPLWQRLTAAFVLTFILGCWTELLQFFSVERTPDWVDVLFDSSGGLGGIIIYALGEKLRIRLLTER